MQYKKYSIYVETDQNKNYAVRHTDSDSQADFIYGQYIDVIKRGGGYLDRTDIQGRIIKVILVRHQDKAKFSYSSSEGYREIFKEAA